MRTLDENEARDTVDRMLSDIARDIAVLKRWGGEVEIEDVIAELETAFSVLECATTEMDSGPNGKHVVSLALIIEMARKYSE